MEDIERTPFGRRLYSARITAGFSQEEAAKAVGMKSQGTLSEAEISGKRSGFTSQLATLYNVNADWLATGKGNKELGAQPPPLQLVRDPILDDLEKLEKEDQEYWRELIRAAAIEAEAKRKLANSRRLKHKERDCEQDIHDPPIDRRRTA